MRTWIIAAMMLLTMVPVAFAETVTLTWDTVADVTGYNVYLDGQLYQPTNAPPVTLQIKPGKHSFHVTAYNEWGESAPSNTVTTPDVAGVPANVKLVITIDATQGTSK